MDTQDIRRISKKLSLLLRHRPELYQLELDEQGWCEVDALLSAFVLLRVDAAAMHQGGYSFFLSENGVWLTEAVPVRYLQLARS